ncbi:hypothetical protein ACGFRG_28390 [Streptomyces sp. NPDC048696]|uniref:hypothetical protein n=1 Tax=Streptomyces sp. NPDC048696 TaxID=3365585 RepID=UPI003715D8B8
MSGENPDLAAPRAALAAITDGINKTLGELKDIGMVGEGSVGRGFSELALSGMELGHSGLTSEFKTFCDRWEWGVRGLAQEGNGFAHAVGLSAGVIYEEEHYVSDSFKVLANSVNGDPNLSEEEVAKKSWGDLATQTPFDGADYSADSFKQAQKDVNRTWDNASYDIQAGVMDRMADAGVIDERTRAQVDEVSRRAVNPDQEVVDRAHWGRD